MFISKSLQVRNNVFAYAGFIRNAYELHRHTHVGEILAHIAGNTAVNDFYGTEIPPGRNIVPKRETLNIDEKHAENSSCTQEKTLPIKNSL